MSEPMFGGTGGFSDSSSLSDVSSLSSGSSEGVEPMENEVRGRNRRPKENRTTDDDDYGKEMNYEAFASDGAGKETRKILIRDKTKKSPCLKWTFFCLKHPLTRISVALSVLILNFVVFIEDPISYSDQDAVFYGFGRVFNYVFTTYPPASEPLWIAFKVMSWSFCIVLGVVLGKYLIHDALLRDFLGLAVFKNDMGSWPVMTATTFGVLVFGTTIYNALISKYMILKDSETLQAYTLTDHLFLKETHFGKIALLATWLCDCLNLFVIIDTMLQDLFKYDKRRTRYGCSGNLCLRTQRFWDDSRRIVFFACAFLVLVATSFIIASDIEYDWILYSKGRFSWDQTQRSLTCAMVIFLGVLMFVQDWDFPNFKNGGESNQMMGCGNRIGCKSKRVNCKFACNGKWVNYGALMIVLVLDTNLYINQMAYVPKNYAQVADVDNYVWNIVNQVSDKRIEWENATYAIYFVNDAIIRFDNATSVIAYLNNKTNDLTGGDNTFNISRTSHRMGAYDGDDDDYYFRRETLSIIYIHRVNITRIKWLTHARTSFVIGKRLDQVVCLLENEQHSINETTTTTSFDITVFYPNCLNVTSKLNIKYDDTGRDLAWTTSFVPTFTILFFIAAFYATAYKTSAPFCECMTFCSVWTQTMWNSMKTTTTRWDAGETYDVL
jgi:hypothetical protein